MIVAVAIQAGLFLVTSEWWIGAAAATAFFIGREHAQAEYRWIERHGGGLRQNLPWWGGFDRRLWNRHAICGWAVPLIIVVSIAALAS